MGQRQIKTNFRDPFGVLWQTLATAGGLDAAFRKVAKQARPKRLMNALVIKQKAIRYQGLAEGEFSPAERKKIAERNA